MTSAAPTLNLFNPSRLFDATARGYLEPFKCPMFLDCVVCTSGIVQGKATLQKMIESGGGQFDNRMVYQSCTHLVINLPKGR